MPIEKLRISGDLKIWEQATIDKINELVEAVNRHDQVLDAIIKKIVPKIK